MDDLNRKMASGALWMASLRFAVRGLGLVSTMILARLLVPADFGLVAMATSVIAFMELATAFGFDVPLIQNQEADRRHFDTAWTLNVLFYLALTGLLVLVARPAAAFYHEPRLPLVIYVLAAGFAIRGFQNIGVVHFRKDMNFRKEFAVMFSKKAVGVLVTIPLAFYLRSYWALVAGIVAGDVLGVIVTYVFHPFRPRLGLSAAREMLDFSKWLLASNALRFVQQRSPDFLIGRVSGSAALGIFAIGFEISTLPSTELVAPINRVVFPGYSKLARDARVLGQSYLDVLAVIALLLLPASLGLSAVARPLVDVFLGDKWTAAAPLIAVLGIYGGVYAIQTNSASVFNAIGKPYLVAFLMLVNIVMLLGACIPLAFAFGPLGVSAGYLISCVLLAPATFYFVCRETSIRFADLAGVLWRPAVSSLVMYVVIGYVSSILAAKNVASIAMLGALIPLGAAVYSASVVLLWFIAGRPMSAENRLVLIALRRIRKARVRREGAPGA